MIVESGSIRQVYLHPAQMSFCETSSLVETVLGSCVAVTLWERRSHIGCICHAVMPRGGGREPLKYVDSSIRLMLELMDGRRIRRRDIEVKLFGGASMRGAMSGRLNVGQQNVAEALAVLERAGLSPRTSDTGGTAGRKLRFYSATGEVLVGRLRLETRP